MCRIRKCIEKCYNNQLLKFRSYKRLYKLNCYQRERWCYCRKRSNSGQQQHKFRYSYKRITEPFHEQFNNYRDNDRTVSDLKKKMLSGFPDSIFHVNTLRSFTKFHFLSFIFKISGVENSNIDAKKQKRIHKLSRGSLR